MVSAELYNQAIQALNNPQSSQEQKTAAIRLIKNAVIGNKTKKLQFMPVVPQLIQILSSQKQEYLDCQIQAAIAIGSFAYGTVANIENLVQSGAILPLLECLQLSQTPKLVEAAARALKAIFQHSSVPREQVFSQGNRHILSLIQLLSYVDSQGQDSTIAQLPALGAIIIARCAEKVEEQNMFVQAGALPYLIKLVRGSHLKARESALDAIGSLCRQNEISCKQVVLAMNGEQNLVQLFLGFLRDTRPEMRLISCQALVYFYRCNSVPNQVDNVKVHVIPALVKLSLDQSLYIQEKAPLILGYLVCENDQLQKFAAEADAVGKLSLSLSQVAAAVKTREDDPEMDQIDKDQLQQLHRIMEAVFLALANCCSLREESRKLVIDAKVLPHVVDALSNKNVGVRSAACQCARSLSRSVKQLRTSLVDAGIAEPLFKLLFDEAIAVQTTASATLCNVVLDFSPMKKVVLENGGVEKLVQLASSMEDVLRLNSVWALKNLLYQADSDIKKTVMTHLTYPMLDQLINDSEVNIQEQALNLLRNLACGKESDIEEVFRGFGGNRLISLLENKIEHSTPQPLQQALFVIVNIATGNEEHKKAILQNESLLRQILRRTAHNVSEIRVATVWCVINMTWPEDRGSPERVRRLKQIGFEDRLRQLADDADSEVKDRVKTALQHLGSQPSGPGSATAGSGSQSGTIE